VAAPDVPATIQIAVAVIAAFGGVVVALIARAGNRTARAEHPFRPNEESGEHAHTRDIIKNGIKRVESRLASLERETLSRFDRLDAVRGMEKQQRQVEASRGHLRGEDDV
jgi:hypothetical protein